MLFDDPNGFHGGAFGWNRMAPKRNQSTVQPAMMGQQPIAPLRGPRGGYQPPTPQAGPMGAPMMRGNYMRPHGLFGTPTESPVGNPNPMPIPDGGPHWRQNNGGVFDQPVGGGGGPMPIPGRVPHWRNGGGFLGGPVGDQNTGGGGGPMPIPGRVPHWRNGGGFVSTGNPTSSNDFGATSMTRAREDYLRNNPQGPAGPGAPDALGGGFLGGPVGDQNVGGGGGPMPLPLKGYTGVGPYPGAFTPPAPSPLFSPAPQFDQPNNDEEMRRNLMLSMGTGMRPWGR